jgi:uncharacterized protein (DUF427 family)
VDNLYKEPLKTMSASGRRIRILWKGRFIADTTNALYVWEKPQYPYFYVPLKDVNLHICTGKDVKNVANFEAETDSPLAKIFEYSSSTKDGDYDTLHYIVFEGPDDLDATIEGFVRFEFNEMGKSCREPLINHSNLIPN